MIDHTEKIQILAVDDDPNIIKALKRVFMETEYSIKFFDKGSDVVEYIETCTPGLLPDLILSDIKMPGMDGYETVKKVQSIMDAALLNGEGSRASIIFLTGSDDSKSILKGFEAGAIDYVTKPFLNEELLARVNTHMELKSQRDQILQMSYDQKQLIRVLCHDLTNPLGAIHGLICEFDNAESFFSIRDVIKDGAAQCLDIVEHVRILHSLTSGKQKLATQPVNMSYIITSACDLLKQKFEAKGIQIVMEVPENIYVIADETVLYSSIINNLLTNALKFSYSGNSVLLKLKVEGEFVHFSVCDTGRGMSEGVLNSLFDILASTSHPGTDGESGTGFGMPLVKKFVDMFGGSIDVISRSKRDYPESHGTTVKITLRGCDGL